MSIVMLGDSLIEHGDWSTLLGQKVENFGISGDTTQGVLHRLVSLPKEIDKIFIMIGINDLLWQVSASHVVENIETILMSLKQENTHSVLCLQSILPVYSEAKINQNIASVNARLKMFCQEHSILWLDLYEYFADSTGSLRLSLTTDGVHLSDEGYGVWASRLKEYC